MSDLDAILSGTELTGEAVAEPEAVEVEEAEQSSAEPETEPEAAEDSTPEPKKEKEADASWQFEAYKDEKRKRQELEKKLQELQQPKAQKKAPDVFEDQEGFTSHIQNQINHNSLNMKANMSQFLAEREFGKDVVMEKLEAFRAMTAEDPNLQNRVFNAVSPYHEMIELVNKAEKLKQLDNVDQLEAKIRAEVEEKVRAEFEAKYSDKMLKRESVTPSLNSKTSAAGDDHQPDSLDKILGR